MVSLINYLRYLARHFAYFTLAFFIVSSIYLYNLLKHSNYFPIKSVQVVGLQHISQTEMKDALRPLVMRGFFSVNVETIHDRLLQMPWVADALVRRRWPDMVDVLVRERVPLAQWNRNSLLSADGELFAPKDMAKQASLADFVGPDGQQITMLKYFVKINRILTPIHVKISYLELTPDMSWKLKLDSGMVLKVGYSDILTDLTHFVKVYSKIVGERAKDVEYIDLRYPNGMAVKWKKTYGKEA